MLLPIADYAPDLPPNNSSGASSNIVNAFPRTKESYGPISSLASYSSNTLLSACLGALAVPDPGGNNYVFAGDTQALYVLNPGSAAFTELDYGYAVPVGEFWNMTYFSPRVIAVSESVNVQSFVIDSTMTTVSGESLGTGNGSLTTFSGTLVHAYSNPNTLTVTAGTVTGTDNGQGAITGTGITSGSINYKTGAWSVTFTVAVPNLTAITAGYKYGGNFQDLAGSPPQARYCATVRNWLMLGNTTDGTNGAQPQRVQWCAIGDPTTWPTAGSLIEAELLAGSQVIPGDHGWIMGLVGNLGTSDGAIFFERAIWRMVFVGSPDIFAFYPCEGVRGCPAPKSIAQLGSLVYYLGEDGFYAFDGSNSKPIGLNRVDKTFWNNVNITYLSNTIAAVDPLNKLVMWSFPSVNSSSGVPDTMFIYNWALDKWSSAQISVEYIFRSITQGYSLEQLDNVSPPNDLDTLPYSLDSRQWTGGAITIGAFSSTNGLAFFTGSALAATLDTVESEIFPDEGNGYRHAFVHNTTPMVDGGTPTVQMLGRNNLQGAVTTYSTSAIDSEGNCPALAENRFFRGRITTAAAATWAHCQGLQIQARPTGRR
jgi:hypothetical protein